MTDKDRDDITTTLFRRLPHAINAAMVFEWPATTGTTIQWAESFSRVKAQQKALKDEQPACPRCGLKHDPDPDDFDPNPGDFNGPITM